MSSPEKDDSNNGGNGSKSKASSPWFGSFFDNDPSTIHNEINDMLNDFDEEKKQYEEQMRQQRERHRGMFGGMPFFFPGVFGGQDQADSASRHSRDPMEQDLQDLFRRFSADIMSSSGEGTSSMSSSRVFSSQGGGSSVTVRESSRDGAQIDVQLPLGSSMEDVAVDVLQESPCVVQYRVPQKTNKRGSSVERPQQQSTLENRVRLGEYIDCAKLSASVSTAKNMLTVKAPVREKSSTSHHQSRSISVTEDDHSN